MRDEFTDAIIAGVPLLASVPEECIVDWRTFTGMSA
ncbi:DUF2478 domain-containing protein [Bradyrhizobium sp. BRP22]|nr:DUF2478 domain-containing protein [Bradyrhizobium sp. BRP22]